MQFSKSVLVVQQNNYTTKIVNTYIVYDLDNCLKNMHNNFTLKNCLFGVTSIVKNGDKSMCIVAMEWYLVAGGVCVDNSSSYHADNHMNNFLVFGEGPADDINLSVDTAEKKFSINFSKAKGKCCYIILVIIVICLLTEKKSVSLQLIIKMPTSQENFV